MVDLKLKYIEELKEPGLVAKRTNLLKILGLGHDEKAFSDIIAEIVKSTYGMDFFRTLLQTVKLNLPFKNPGNYTVYREDHRIDISIVFSEKKYIIGIENKIFAKELKKQIARYQDVFQKYYAGYDGIFLFLTPTGYSAATANAKSKYTCYNISYTNILTALESIRNQEEVRDCINQFIDAIKEGIVMDKSTKKQINKIWGNQDNKAYLEKLIANKPTLLDIKGILTSKIEAYLKEKGDSFGEEPYIPSNCEIVYFSKNINKKMPVWFVFYDSNLNKLNNPFMWLVVHENTTQKKLQEIKTCNEVFAFEKITGKPWLSIYSGKEPNYIMNEDHDYGEKMAEKFFKAFMEWYNKVIVDMKNIP